METIVAIKDLYKKYPNAETPALDRLQLEIKSGKITGLLGVNGAGKTTTISILFGLLKQDSGTAKVFGLDAHKDSDDIKRLVGLVPQQIALYPELSAKENLLYFGCLYQIEKQTLKQRVNDLLEDFGLTEAANKRVKHYSGGMKRRANIIAGLLHEPKLVILDEPTAGVDIHSRSLILDYLKKYNALGNSIIYTSHQLEEADKICDEIAILGNGKLIIHDTVAQLKASTPEAKDIEEVFMHYFKQKI